MIDRLETNGLINYGQAQELARRSPQAPAKKEAQAKE